MWSTLFAYAKMHFLHNDGNSNIIFKKNHKYVLIMDIIFKFDGTKFRSINTKNEIVLISNHLIMGLGLCQVG